MKTLMRMIVNMIVVFVLLALPASAFAESGVASTFLGTHTVKRGETLICIARAYNVDPDAISKANNVKDANKLYVGQKLSIPDIIWKNAYAGKTCERQFENKPSVCLESYTVQRGDTLSKIARSYGMTVDALVKANKIQNANRIYVGQVLCIPK